MTKKVINKLAVPSRLRYESFPPAIAEIFSSCFPDYVKPALGDLRLEDYKGVRSTFLTEKRDLWSRDPSAPRLTFLRLEYRDETYKSFYKKVKVYHSDGGGAYIDKDEFFTKVNQMVAAKASALCRESDSLLDLAQAAEREKKLKEVVTEFGLDGYVTVSCQSRDGSRYHQTAHAKVNFTAITDVEACDFILWLSEQRKASK
jgi:hypothetical protein